MDYQFSLDALNRPIAHCSMDHEAFADWLTHDLGRNHQQLTQILEQVDALLAKRARHYQVQGQEYQLTLTQADAIIRSQQGSGSAYNEPYGDNISSLDHDDALLFEDDDALTLDTEDLSLDDQHGHSMCGLEDFQELLQAWQEFI